MHDRYQDNDSAEFAGLVYQLCCVHLLRYLDDAAQIYPDALWSGQIARALRELIGHARLAHDAGRTETAPVRTRWSPGSGTVCWSGRPIPATTAAALVNARPGCCRVS